MTAAVATWRSSLEGADRYSIASLIAKLPFRSSRLRTSEIRPEDNNSLTYARLLSLIRGSSLISPPFPQVRDGVDYSPELRRIAVLWSTRFSYKIDSNLHIIEELYCSLHNFPRVGQDLSNLMIVVSMTRKTMMVYLQQGLNRLKCTPGVVLLLMSKLVDGCDWNDSLAACFLTK